MSEMEKIIELTQAKAAAYDEMQERARRLWQSFNPPADMSVNEKVAWREGLYYALDHLMMREVDDE